MIEFFNSVCKWIVEYSKGSLQIFKVYLFNANEYKG